MLSALALLGCAVAREPWETFAELTNQTGDLPMTLFYGSERVAEIPPPPRCGLETVFDSGAEVDTLQARVNAAIDSPDALLDRLESTVLCRAEWRQWWAGIETQFADFKPAETEAS